MKPAKAPLLTPGELLMVKMAVLLPVMLDVLQTDINRINQVKLRLNLLYVKGLSKAQDSVLTELQQIKAELRQLGIKIYEEERASDGIHVKFKCRGYDHKFSLLWDKVRTEILKKGSQYLGVSLTEGE